MMSDARIVSGILNRDQAAFNALVDVYGGFIKSVVSYHLSFLHEYREECINDILLSLWQNMSCFDENKNSLKNWIGAVCKYKAIDYKRKYCRRFCTLPLDEAFEYPETQTESELKQDIEEILSCLKPEDRELFYRHYILGEKVSEISATSDKTTQALMSRLSRGRKHIRKMLK